MSESHSCGAQESRKAGPESPKSPKSGKTDDSAAEPVMGAVGRPGALGEPTAFPVLPRHASVQRTGIPPMYVHTHKYILPY